MRRTAVPMAALVGVFALSTTVLADDTRTQQNAGITEAKKILMVVTSADRMNNDEPTGLWLEEFAVPYLEFVNAGFEVTVASPKGGAAPIDPRSKATDEQAENWSEAAKRLQRTVTLEGLKADDFEAIFVPGGHGTMFDLPDHPKLAKLIGDFDAQGRIIAAVCHGPAALVGVKREDGRSIVDGRTFTAFTNDEEQAVELVEEMPFLLQTRLTEEGGQFVGKPNFTPHAVRDGNLVTGQNPASSAEVARLVIEAIAERMQTEKSEATE